MLKFAKQTVSALIFVAALSSAVAQPSGGPGPGPVPDPWINNGGTLYYDQGGITLPSTVTGGSKGVGTVNAQALYINGVPVFSGAGTIIFSSRVDASISADQNNWTPTGSGTYASASAIFVNGGLGDFNITGLTGGAEGRFVWLFNSGTTNNIVLKNQSASSTATNRFLLTTDVTLAPNMPVALRYDATAGRWRQADFYQSASPTFTGTITAQSLVLTGPTVSVPLLNVTGGTPPANGIYLSGINSLGFATNGTDRAHFGATGNLLWDGSANAAAIINQASSSTAPTFVPDQAHTDTGIGGTGGAVSVVSNGVQVLNASSSTGVTVATPSINSGNTQVATTCYADRTSAVALSDNGSTSAGLVMQPAAPCSTTLTEPYADGLVVSFTAPVSRARQMTISGGTAHPIRDPGGITQVVGDAIVDGAACDICKNTSYRLKWVLSPGFWQMLSPAPQAASIGKPTVQGAYLQNGDATSFAITYAPYVHDPDWDQWKWVDFVTFGVGFGSAYIDGTLGALQQGHGYHVYYFIPPGSGGPTSDPNGNVKLDFVSRYFDNNLNPGSGATFQGSINSGTLTISSAITGTVAVGESIQCLPGAGTCPANFNQGSWLSAGAGVSWLVTGTTPACVGTPCNFKTIPPKYAPGKNGINLFIDAAGNIATYVGVCFVQSLTDNTSYFDRYTALTTSGGHTARIPGPTCQSMPFSQIPQQTLTVSSGPAAFPGAVGGGTVTGPVTGSLAELLPTGGTPAFASETLYTIHEWTPKNAFSAGISYACGAGTTSAQLRITTVAAWTGSGGATQTLYDKTLPCPAGTNLEWPVPILSHSFSDGAYIIKMFGMADGTGTTFTTQPSLDVRY